MELNAYNTEKSLCKEAKCLKKLVSPNAGSRSIVPSVKPITRVPVISLSFFVPVLDVSTRV